MFHIIFFLLQPLSGSLYSPPYSNTHPLPYLPTNPYVEYPPVHPSYSQSPSLIPPPSKPEQQQPSFREPLPERRKSTGKKKVTPAGGGGGGGDSKGRGLQKSLLVHTQKSKPKNSSLGAKTKEGRQPTQRKQRQRQRSDTGSRHRKTSSSTLPSGGSNNLDSIRPLFGEYNFKSLSSYSSSFLVFSECFQGQIQAYIDQLSNPVFAQWLSDAVEKEKMKLKHLQGVIEHLESEVSVLSLETVSNMEQSMLKVRIQIYISLQNLPLLSSASVFSSSFSFSFTSFSSFVLLAWYREPHSRRVFVRS